MQTCGILFGVDGKAPRTVIVMTVEVKIYFQCAGHRPVRICGIRTSRVDPGSLPTPGQILADMSENRVGGEEYDREWPGRARNSLW